ncbi:MAG: hypothetical protein HYU56_00015 [Candidatus Aenigmarchaeota archaeon]|nr:hypothetical protein [Candidatus Aenigmarchaeota archaeon]
MIKIVLDTNIFVSSIFWFGPSHKVAEKALDGKIEVFTSIETSHSTVFKQWFKVECELLKDS